MAKVAVKEVIEVEPIKLLGVDVPARFVQMITDMRATILERNKVNEETQAEKIATVSAGATKAQNAVAALESTIKSLQERVTKAKIDLAANQAEVKRCNNELSGLVHDSEAVDREILSFLEQMTAGAVKAPAKPTKARASGQSSATRNVKYRIYLDGESLEGMSAGKSLGNLAWYKFGKCSSARLIDALAEQNSGVRPFTPEHQAHGRLQAVLDGKTFGVELI